MRWRDQRLGRDGECVEVQPARWGEWRAGDCQSACLKHGTGVRLSTRDCLLLPGYEESQQCQGKARHISLCEDLAICGTRSCGSDRRDRVDIAMEVCQRLSSSGQEEDGYVMGSPAKHNYKKPEQACAIYCHRSGEEGWFRPRETFFPDGAWCHHDDTLGDFFCRDHKCQPSNTTIFF